jgi:hypothetical protein
MILSSIVGYFGVVYRQRHLQRQVEAKLRSQVEHAV